MIYGRIKEMNYLDLIKKEIEKVLEIHTPGGVRINFSVDIPELEHGDITTNVCLVASKVLKKSPQEVFDLIQPLLTSPYIRGGIEKIEFKNPGFINFWLKKEFIRNGGKLEKKSFFENVVGYFLEPHLASPINRGGIKSKYFGKKVLVEHTQPNLFKALTVGHLMNNFTGEFIVNILKEFNASVKVLFYPSDKSIGIAKALIVLKNEGGLENEIFKKGISEIVKYFGHCYVRGVANFKRYEEEKNEEKIREIKNVANNIFNETGEDFKLFERCKEINLKYFKNFLEKLESHFDATIFESEAGVEGKKIVLENIGKGVFRKSDEAIIYEPGEERKDINTTVFVNSEGNPTYAGKDLGLLSLKFKKFNPDYSFFITDNEQTPHFKVVLDAAKKINKEWSEKSFHISHGRMTFKGQKMSSRLGGVPNGEEVVETILEAVKEKSGERKIDKDTQLEIALSALRVSVLRAKPGVNIDFDPEKALSFEGDSGPYLCYTSARMHSLLQKGKGNDLFPGCKLSHDGPEINLERKIFQFEKVLEIVVEELAPQKLVTYLFELAGEFNNFYNSTKIITDEKFESEHYLYVVQKTLNVLIKGLHILGITAPEKM